MRFRRPLARPQQLRHLGEGAVLHDLADRVATVEESARLSVDQREGRLAREDAGEAG
jgi:hypothetical protein